MGFGNLISLIIENLARRKGRVMLTAIGVVIGTAAVVILVSLATGLQRNANTQLGGIADLTRIDVMMNYDMGQAQPGMNSKPGGPNDQKKIKKLTPASLKEIAAIPGVTAVIGRDFIKGEAKVTFGKLETWSSIMALNTNDLEPLKPQVALGELSVNRGTAVVGGWVAKNFMDSGKMSAGQPIEPQAPELLGNMLRVILTKYDSEGKRTTKVVSLKVTGVLKESFSENDSTIFINMNDLTAYNEWFTNTRVNYNRDGYSNVVAKVSDSKVIADVTQQIKDLGFMAHSPMDYAQGINSFFVIMQIIFGGVGAISLLVAAIGIANTMTMAILERTREIGLMKAIGATNKDILSIFLGEAAGIGFIGGLGGVLLGWGAGKLINTIALTYMANQATQGGGMPATTAVYTPLWLPIFTLLFATIIGLISGLYPSVRAANLVPVNALKYE